MSKAFRILVCVAVLSILISLPGAGGSASRTLTGDLNGDGDVERYLLAGHRLTVYGLPQDLRILESAQ
jgi:hypothetical protein